MKTKEASDALLAQLAAMRKEEAVIGAALVDIRNRMNEVRRQLRDRYRSPEELADEAATNAAAIARIHEMRRKKP